MSEVTPPYQPSSNREPDEMRKLRLAGIHRGAIVRHRDTGTLGVIVDLASAIRVGVRWDQAAPRGRFEFLRAEKLRPVP